MEATPDGPGHHQHRAHAGAHHQRADPVGDPSSRFQSRADRRALLGRAVRPPHAVDRVGAAGVVHQRRAPPALRSDRVRGEAGSGVVRDQRVRG
jgi:hypothetical protein